MKCISEYVKGDGVREVVYFFGLDKTNVGKEYYKWPALWVLTKHKHKKISLRLNQLI